MGLGISLKKSGRHIAYTAGTGVLPFLDLVAYLLIRVIELNGGPNILDIKPQGYSNSVQEDRTNSEFGSQNSYVNVDAASAEGPLGKEPLDLNTFSFELHTSFATVDDAIGLELIENLELLCHKFKMPDLFVHHTRIAVDGHYSRYDQEAFKEKFSHFEKERQKEIVKVWVCGPPLMQENFDRA